MMILALISTLPLLTLRLAPTSHAEGPRAGLDESQMGLGAAPSPQVYVQFRLEAAGASQVALAGSFTGWKPEFEMRESAPGVWSILLPLRPGIHDYAFIVDGERWVADPHALQVEDGFGGANSRIALPAPAAGGQRI
jgi:1,4-alpha-glucan branching enzyme